MGSLLDIPPDLFKEISRIGMAYKTAGQSPHQGPKLIRVFDELETHLFGGKSHRGSSTATPTVDYVLYNPITLRVNLGLPLAKLPDKVDVPIRRWDDHDKLQEAALFQTDFNKRRWVRGDNDQCCDFYWEVFKLQRDWPVYVQEAADWNAAVQALPGPVDVQDIDFMTGEPVPEKSYDGREMNRISRGPGGFDRTAQELWRRMGYPSKIKDGRVYLTEEFSVSPDNNGLNAFDKAEVVVDYNHPDYVDYTMRLRRRR